MKIIVVGAGAWGTALAASAASQPEHQVTLWGRDAAAIAAMQAKHINSAYLPGLELPQALTFCSGPLPHLDDAVRDQDLIVLATPTRALRDFFQHYADFGLPVISLSKGFEEPRPSPGVPDAAPLGLLAHEIQAQVAPHLKMGVLSGPSFAQEVACGQPTALVAASRHSDVRTALMQAFHSPSLRVYANSDVVGVEVGGAVKNVLAIAAGVLDGLAQTDLPHSLRPGLNARAALITRGVTEMTRLGLALGAQAETFTGLSGLGDLVLTATGHLSRNRKVGLLLAQGKTQEQIAEHLGCVTEGVYCARTVVQRAQRLGVEMPIAQGVLALLDGCMQPDQVVSALMGRDPKAEGQGYSNLC